MAHLYIYEFNIQSSYLSNTEYPATNENFDTIQWWIENDETWRIRLFDYDSDIHVARVNKTLTIEEIESLMIKRYDDVLVGRYNLEGITIHDNKKVIDKMMTGLLEVSRDKKFAFWNHDAREYTTKSNPNELK